MKSILSFIKTMIKSKYVIKSMAIRDIKMKYVGSVLGVIWPIIQPLTTLLIYYFVFSVIFKAKLGGDASNTNYAIWLMCGLFPWMFFGEILSRSSNLILDNASLITKTNFNPEILPVVLIVSSLINHGIAMAFLFIIGIAFSLFHFSFHMLLLPVYTVFIMLFVLGLSWIVSSINVFMRDIGQILTILINLWFYATPIVYGPNLIPARLSWVLKLNPLYYIVEGYRGSILGYSTVDTHGLKYLLLLSLVVLLIGGVIFKRLKRDFNDVL